ncbi:hypothetical protein TELCIR_06306 [Teladorsagia circumcincta]|uniref:Uncharacterized protein n=1 Tax=Teladorsagia circumcincta TaxID=45464 RepID=A0A2G9UPZ3_TELCI|nr:hypothetical protein TELCIR_06306 [Teladorsagia circumcincta]
MFRKPAKKRAQVQVRQRQEEDLSGDEETGVVKDVKRRKRANPFQQSVDETNYEINEDEDGFPEDCFICGKPFVSPVVTRCTLQQNVAVNNFSVLKTMSALQTVNELQDSVGSGSPTEVVYGGTVSPTGDEHRNMSEKVQNMASAIYREFELMIQKYGEDGVKKYMEIEDNLIGQNKELEAKIESLESIMRMLELKAKNASDHASRLEEREADQKAEFDRLHERYNALLRTHVDHMERTKYLMGNDKFELMQNMPLPQAQLRTRMGMAASVDASSIRGVSDLISAHMSQSTTMDVNLANHISSEADWQDEFSSDVEPSPREATSEEEKAAPSSASESTARNTKGSEREEEYGLKSI